MQIMQQYVIRWSDHLRLAHRLVLTLSLGLLAAGLLWRPAQAVDVEEITTDSGLTYWLVSDSTVPLITVNFSFKGGSTLDPVGKEGLANLLSATLDEGAGPLDSQAFQAALEDASIRLSFSAGRERFSGTLRSLSARQDEAFELLELAINQPRFDPEPVARMKQQLAASVRSNLNDGDTIASDVWFETAFPAHPYGRSGDGSEDSIDRLSAEDLKVLRPLIFTRDDLKIAIVGDIDAATASASLDKVFAALPNDSMVDALPSAADVMAGQIHVPLDKPQTILRIGSSGITADDPDFITAYVVNHILGGGAFTSRLYKEVRETRGLAYSVWSYASSFEENGFFLAGVGTRTTNASQALDTIKAEIATMADSGPTKQELRAAKDFLKGAYALRFDTSDKVARQLVGLQLQDRDVDYINRRNDKIEAVSLEDARRVAKRLYDRPLLTVSVGAADPFVAVDTN